MKNQFRKYLAVLLAAMTLLTVFALPISAEEKSEGIPHGTVISEDDPSFAQIEEDLTLPSAAEISPDPEATPNTDPDAALSATNLPVQETAQHTPNLRLLSIGTTSLSATVVQDNASHIHGAVVYRIKTNEGSAWSDWTESGTFEDLQPGTKYDLAAKYLEHTYDQYGVTWHALESEETIRTVITAATDEYIVTNEDELRALLDAALTVTERNYIPVYNGNDITITQSLTIPQLPEGKRLVFNMNGFELKGPGVRGDALITVRGDATIDNGTIISTTSSQTAIKIDTTGALYLREINITADTALENHGTIVGMGYVNFTGNNGLLNYGIVEASAAFTATEMTGNDVLVDNRGRIDTLDVAFQHYTYNRTVIHNQSGASIGTLSGIIKNYGAEYIEGETGKDADGLICNDGLIEELDLAEVSTRGTAGVSNFGTINCISAGIYTKPSNSAYPDNQKKGALLGAPIVNQSSGEIGEIRDCKVQSTTSTIINYGKIGTISGGKYTCGYGYTVCDNIQNYGSITDICGGGFKAPSYDWQTKQYFVVNKEDGTYTIRDGYNISYSAITYPDGTTSDGYRMVDKAHTVKWILSSNKTILYTNKDLSADKQANHNQGVVNVIGQHTGALQDEFVEGEAVQLYAFDRSDKVSGAGVLIADKNALSLSYEQDNTKAELPKSYYGDIQASGLTDWTNLTLDAKSWNWQVGYGYSAEDKTSRLVNQQYFVVANTGWQDQDGNIYASSVATKYANKDTFTMPTQDLTLTEVDRCLINNGDAASYITNVITRNPTNLRIANYSSNDGLAWYSVERYSDITVYPQLSIDNGETWQNYPEKGQSLIFDELEPGKGYILSLRFIAQGSNNIPVLPSGTVRNSVATTKGYYPMPEALEYKQIGNDTLVVTVPGGYSVHPSGVGTGVTGGASTISEWKNGKYENLRRNVSNDKGLTINGSSAQYVKLTNDTTFTVTELPISTDPEHPTRWYILLQGSGTDYTSFSQGYYIYLLPQWDLPELKIKKRTDTSIEFELPDGVPESAIRVQIKINGEWSDWQDTLSFEGLEPGTEYEIRVQIIGTGDHMESEIAELTVRTKIVPDAPATPPVLISKSGTSLIVETEEGLEYSIDGGKTWQTIGTFEGLTEGTEYEIISRYAETEDSISSEAGPALTITTKARPTAEIVPPKVLEVTETTITVEVVKGQEYALRIADKSHPVLIAGWRDTGIFADLQPGVKYEIITRIKETDEFVASEIGIKSVEVTTINTTENPPVIGGNEGDTTEIHEPYIYGYNDLTVRPGRNLTRAEAASIFARLLPEDVAKVSDISFTDTDPAEWYYDQVQKLAGAGYLSGYKDGTFRPNASITRAEFIAIAIRVYASTGDGKGLSSFTDLSGHWAQETMKNAAAKGWIYGYKDGTVKPNSKITRAEAIAIVNRILGRSPAQNSEEITVESPWSDLTNTGAWYYEDVMESSVLHNYQPV